jgi:hypothetical protein
VAEVVVEGQEEVVVEVVAVQEVDQALEQEQAAGLELVLVMLQDWVLTPGLGPRSALDPMHP